MKRTFITIVLSLLVSAAAVASGGPKSAGCGFSYYTMTGEYQHWNAERSGFHSATVTFDFEGLFNRTVLFPGVNTSYAYNFYFGRSLSNGGQIALYTGPGITTGWVKDRNTLFGIMLGLKVDVGFEYSSPRSPLSIGAKINPTLGMHIHRKDYNIVMDHYINGLISGMIPEFTVRYDFGRSFDRLEGDMPASVLTFGVETSYSFMLLRIARQNYYDQDGIRYYTAGNSLCSSNHFLALAHIGTNIGRYFNISLASGYTTISYEQKHAIPLLLRASVFYGDRSAHKRIYNYFSGGPAFSLSDSFYSVPWMYAAGAGYRFVLDRRSRVDFKVAIVGSYCSPKVPEVQSVTLSREYLLGFNIGVNASF